MKEDITAEATERLQNRLDTMDPLVETATDDKTHRFYNTQPDHKKPVGEGLYAVTIQSDGPENICYYGQLSFSDYTTPRSAYLRNTPEEYHDFINDHYSLIESAEENTIRSVYKSLFQNSGASELSIPFDETNVYIHQNCFCVAREEIEEEETTLAKLARMDYQSFGDSELTEEEYESVDWDDLSEVTHEARSAWRREKDGFLPDDWDGYAMLLDFEDWRSTAQELDLHTSLSTAQSLAIAVLSVDQSQTNIADILGKDDTTVSRQLTEAGKKIIQARKLTEQVDTIDSFSLDECIRTAERKEEERIADVKYERSKTYKTAFYKCPNCGRDTGEWRGSLEEGEFVADAPPEFIVGLQGYRQGQAKMVTCPDCDHEASERRFLNAWEDEHGRIPEPEHIPHPEPTAERLYNQARSAFEAKQERRY